MQSMMQLNFTTAMSHSSLINVNQQAYVLTLTEETSI